MSGPTVAGSIVARLSAENSDYNAAMDDAQARAIALGKTDPHVKVDVDAAAALTAMESVKSATTQVSVAQLRLKGTSGDLTLAMNRLDNAISAGVRDEAKLASLAEIAARAQSNQATSVERLTAAQEALAAAEAQVTAATVGEAAAVTDEDNSEKSANATHGATISRMGLIIAAIAVLVPMLGALMGYAVGVAGALAGMGAAGVLGIIGIKQAMEAGNTAGKQYSAGLNTLKLDMNALASTSAGAMLYSFQQAVGIINADMPTLNGQISTFSSMLGNLGTTVLAGVLNSFKVLNPLFVQAGQYVQSLADGFKRWTADGGLQKFALYAQNALPQVAQTLGALATGALHLVEALTPLGTVILGGLKAFGDFLSGIPSNVLVDLASGAGAFFIAFQAWAALTPVIEGVAVAIGAVGAAEDLALGPIGLVLAAVAAAAAIFAVNAAATDQASAAQVSYTSALQASNGALDESIRKSVAKQLSDSGALQTAKQYHLNLSTVTDAVLGNADATKKVTEATNKYGQQLFEVHGASGAVTNSYTAMSDKGRKFLDTVTGQKGALKDSVQAFKDQTAAALGSAASTSQTAIDLGITQSTYEALSAAVDAATNASKNWKTEQDLINGVAQSVEAANITMAQSYQSAATTIEANIKASDASKGTSLDINTQYGAQNHQLILGQVQDAQAVAEAQIAAYVKSGDSQTVATNKANANLASQKQSIIDHMVALGLDRGAVTDLVNSELTIPPQITQTFTLKGIEDGTQKLSDYLKLMGGIHDITQRITVEAVYVGGAQNLATTGGGVAAFSSGGPVYRAAGGAIDATYLAGGGQFKPRGTDTVPAMLTPGEFVLNPNAASYNPAFTKAYNADPQAALSGVGGGGNMTVSLEGATIMLSVDGQQMTGVITQQILKVNDQQGMALSNGVRPLA